MGGGGGGVGAKDYVTLRIAHHKCEAQSFLWPGSIQGLLKDP